MEIHLKKFKYKKTYDVKRRIYDKDDRSNASSSLSVKRVR